MMASTAGDNGNGGGSSGSARPLALCLGMSVAMLAGVQVSRHNRQFWKSIQGLRNSSSLTSSGKTTTPRRTRLASGVGAAAIGASRSMEKAALVAAGAEELRPRFLDCAYQFGQVNKARVSTETISVVQLNILASNLATRNHFPYVVDASLNWDYRKMTLLRQLEELDADVVCLEELSDYWTFFKPELHELGYDSVYVKRPSINVSNWSGEKKQDGCGIFYKKDKFELKECESINFHDPHDRVALLALLKMRHFAQFVLVGCTHLWWNAKKVDHQMAEVFELEEEIIRMSSDVKDKYETDLVESTSGARNVPIIICGDFNNSPESPLYEYMENSFMQKPNLEGMQDAFRSAYAHYNYNTRARPDHIHEESTGEELEGKKDEPPHTTVNFRRCWTIDYIWYSQTGLVPKRVLEIPSEAVLRSEEGPPHWFNRLAMLDSFGKSGRLPTSLQGNHNGIPNSRFGSDHVPIMAEFAFVRPRGESDANDHQQKQHERHEDEDEETKA